MAFKAQYFFRSIARPRALNSTDLVTLAKNYEGITHAHRSNHTGSLNYQALNRNGA